MQCSCCGIQGSIEDIHRDAREIPGHPIHTFMLENRAIEKLLEESLQVHLRNLWRNPIRKMP